MYIILFVADPYVALVVPGGRDNCSGCLNRHVHKVVLCPYILGEEDIEVIFGLRTPTKYQGGPGFRTRVRTRLSTSSLACRHLRSWNSLLPTRLGFKPLEYREADISHHPES